MTFSQEAKGSFPKIAPGQTIEIKIITNDKQEGKPEIKAEVIKPEQKVEQKTAPTPAPKQDAVKIEKKQEDKSKSVIQKKVEEAKKK